MKLSPNRIYGKNYGRTFIYLFIFPNRKIIYDALDNGPNQFKLIKFKLFLSNKTQQKDQWVKSV